MSLFLKPAKLLSNYNIFWFSTVLWAGAILIPLESVALMLKPFVLFFLFGYFWQDNNHSEDVSGYAPTILFFWLADVGSFWFADFVSFMDLFALTVMTIFLFHRLAELLRNRDAIRGSALTKGPVRWSFVLGWAVCIGVYFTSNFLIRDQSSMLRFLTYLALWVQCETLLDKPLQLPLLSFLKSSRLEKISW